MEPVSGTKMQPQFLFFYFFRAGSPPGSTLHPVHIRCIIMSAFIWCASLLSPAFQVLPHAHMTQSSFDFFQMVKNVPVTNQDKGNYKVFLENSNLHHPDFREDVLKNQNT